MWRFHGCPYRQDVLFTGAFPSEGTSPPEAGFHPAGFLVLPPLDKRIVDTDDSRSTISSSFLKMVSPIWSQSPTTGSHKEQEELGEVERKTCNLCPLSKNKQELEVFQVSFDKGSDYPKFGEFPHLLSVKSHTFSHDSHPQRMVRGSWSRAMSLEEPCKNTF